MKEVCTLSQMTYTSDISSHTLSILILIKIKIVTVTEILIYFHATYVNIHVQL